MKKLNCLVCDFSFMSLKYMNAEADLVSKLTIQTYFSSSSSYCSSTDILYSFNIYCVLSNWCRVQVETLSFLKKPLAVSLIQVSVKASLNLFHGSFPWRTPLLRVFQLSSLKFQVLRYLWILLTAVALGTFPNGIL